MSPVAPFSYFSSATAGEDQIVKDLEGHPPDWVVIISRDLREYGIQRYGEQPDEGQQILRWIGKNYETAASIGGNPLDYRQRGAVILGRKRGLP